MALGGRHDDRLRLVLEAGPDSDPALDAHATDAVATVAGALQLARAGKLTRERERDLLAVWRLQKSGLAIA